MSTYRRNLKKKSNYGLGILLFLIMFASSLNLRLDSTQKSIVFHDGNMKGNIKIANFWSLPFIHVDNNWSLTEQTYDWITGNGSWGNPYVIENVTINGQNSSSCILIENSNTDYFIIRNNTVYNSSLSVSVQEAGIKLVNSERGIIINNNASFNNGHGILLSNSHNNSIIGNTVIENSESLGTDHSGITLSSSNNNTVRMNNLLNNTNYGINVYFSNDNKIFENTAEGTGYNGILVYYSDNNVIKENNVSLSGFTGILIYGTSDNNFVEDNLVFNNNDGGIYARYWDASDSPTFNKIINNVIFDHNFAWGIHIGYGVNTIIASNEIYNNRDGIEISNSNNSIIYDNDIYDNGFGIDIANMGSINNTIYLNSLFDNTNNGIDNGVNNTWDNGAIGNYWDDYSGDDDDLRMFWLGDFNIPFLRFYQKKD